MEDCGRREGEGMAGFGVKPAAIIEARLGDTSDAPCPEYSALETTAVEGLVRIGDMEVCLAPWTGDEETFLMICSSYPGG
jgi:hypothetical protein